MAFLGAAWQTAAGEDFRGRLGGRLIGPSQPPGPVSPASGQALNLAIGIPAASEIETSDTSMTLRGSATGGSGIIAVNWRSSAGYSGSAMGTANWATGLIPLELGTNEITVTAYDRSGQRASDVIVVRRDSGVAQGVTLTWLPPTQRVDGTVLTDLAGYNIHYGRMSGVYDHKIRIDNPGLVSYVVRSLGPGDWYFTMTAFDRNGTESGYAKEVLKRVQ